MDQQDDWHKLTPDQQFKVQNLACNNWQNIQVFIISGDSREGSQYKQPQDNLLITFEVNGKKLRTTISSKSSGLLAKMRKNGSVKIK